MKRNRLHNLKPGLYIAGFYFLIGIGWIYLSDRLPSLLFNTSDQTVIFQTVKGWLYVAVTSILLFLLIKRQIQKRNKLIHSLTSDNLLLNKILNKSTGFSILLTDKQGNVILSKGEAIHLNLISETEEKSQEVKKLENLSSEAILSFSRDLWQTKKPAVQEFEVSGKWYEIYGSIFNSEKNSTGLALLIFKEITARKNTENELIKYRNLASSIHSESEREKAIQQRLINRFLLITENIYDGIILTSTDALGQPATIFEMNNAARDLLNIQNKEISLSDLANLISFQNHTEKERLFHNNYHNNQQIVIHLKTSLPPQPARDLQITARHLQLDNESYVLFLIRENINNPAAPSDDPMLACNHLLNHINCGIMLFGTDGACFFANTYMKGLLGTEIPQNRVLLPNDLVKTGLDINITHQIEKCLNGSAARIPVHPLKKQNGKWFESFFFPVETENGKPAYIIRVVKEITPMIELDQDNKSLRTSLQESSMLKTTFLNNLSHEIRTPMNSILGFLELLSFETTNPAQKEYIKYIQQNSDALFKILNSLIELSQLENKSITTQREWFEIEDLADRLNHLGQQALENNPHKNIRFHLSVPQNLKRNKVYSDKEKIGYISEKILENAFKFTQQGVIEVSMVISPDHYLNITIKDTGSGIKSKNIKNIFIPFTTFKNKEDAVFDGLGLGLPIAKRYADLLGGFIEVQTTEGLGSEFTLKIPQGFSEKTAPKEQERFLLTKILMVQYSFDGINEIQAQFNREETEVLFCSSGMEALEIMLEHPDIDLVITDINLSDMKSTELLKALRRMRSEVPVIAQTAFFVKEEYDQYLQAGFYDYLPKPIKTSRIFRLAMRGIEYNRDR